MAAIAILLQNSWLKKIKKLKILAHYFNTAFKKQDNNKSVTIIAT